MGGARSTSRSGTAVEVEVDASVESAAAVVLNIWMDPERARLLLARERERIERALAGLRETTDSSGDAAEDGSQDLYQDEFDSSLAQDLADQLDALERAEARLEAGTYGLSIESGEPIPDERLEAVPTAERTVAEQALKKR
jgi:DnaK suppressor protein